MNTAGLTKQSVNATLRELLRCLACGKPYVRANLASYRRAVLLETGSAETHCACAGGPITERPSDADAAHWEAAADALATHRARSRMTEEDELAWAMDLCAGKAFADRGEVAVFLAAAKRVYLQRALSTSETLRLRLTVDRVWRRAAIGPAVDRPSVALASVLDYQVTVNRLLIERQVRNRAPMLSRTETDAMEAALLAGDTPATFVDRLAAAQDAQPCGIGCRKPLHCEGCDQCDESTRERRAHARGVDAGPGSKVYWCDGCAETVSAGEHDVFDRVA